MERAIKGSIMVGIKVKDAERRVSEASPFFRRYEEFTIRSASGVLLPSTGPGCHWAVCDGGLFVPLLKAKQLNDNYSSNNIISSSSPSADGPSIHDISTPSTRLCEHPSTSDKEWRPPPLPELREGVDIEIRTYDGKWWLCSLVALGPGDAELRRVLRRLCTGRRGWETRLWTSSNLGFGEFALLKIADEDLQAFEREAYVPIPWAKSESVLSLGTQIRVISSPYGVMSQEIFANSLTGGIVANFLNDVTREGITGENGGFAGAEGGRVMLVDVPVFPGAEGGAVCTRDGELIGLICGTVGFKELIHKGTMALVLSCDALAPWLTAALKTHSKNYAIPRLPMPVRTALPGKSPELIQRGTGAGVMVISIGTSYGSCFTASENGYVITNRHVFDSYLEASRAPDQSSAPVSKKTPRGRRLKENAPAINVRIFPWDGQLARVGEEEKTHRKTVWVCATLIYVAPYPWDIAVVKMHLPDWLRLRIGYKLPAPSRVLPGIQSGSAGHSSLVVPERMCCDVRQGEEIYVVGFGIFTPEANLRSSLTQGVVSQVIRNVSHIPEPPEKPPSLPSISPTSPYIDHEKGEGGRTGTGQRYPIVNPKAEDLPTAIMTSAAVHQGNSGGIVVSHAGKLIGMVTCNLCSPKREGEVDSPPIIALARFNMCIPVNVLAPLISACRRVDTTASDTLTLFRYFDNAFDNTGMRSLTEAAGGECVWTFIAPQSEGCELMKRLSCDSKAARAEKKDQSGIRTGRLKAKL